LINELGRRLQASLRTSGASTEADFLAAAKPIVLWADFLERAEIGACPMVLHALRSVIAEACACAAMGLARPTLTVLRAEIDVALVWIYYSEHPREWRNINVSSDGFKLKSELLRTFEGIEPAFKRRFSILKLQKTRTEDDPYRLLSAHVHLQNESVFPSMSCLADVVQPQLNVQIVALQAEVSEYINDLFFSMYAGDWVALPAELTLPLRARMATPAQYAEFIRPI